MENGERSIMPIQTIYNANRYMVAEYAEANGLLDEWESPGRKLKKAASQNDHLMRFQANVLHTKCNRVQVVYQ